jgi:DNA-binding transcriptional ArsR family regulator
MTNNVGHMTNYVGQMSQEEISMLEPLLGSTNAERALIFILARDEGYARDMARFFDTGLYGIQRQLDKLEAGGILASRRAGRTRLYTFNPRYPFLNELKALLAKALTYYPEEAKTDLTMNRRRPRARGKPL